MSRWFFSRRSSPQINVSKCRFRVSQSLDRRMLGRSRPVRGRACVTVWTRTWRFVRHRFVCPPHEQPICYVSGIIACLFRRCSFHPPPPLNYVMPATCVFVHKPILISGLFVSGPRTMSNAATTPDRFVFVRGRMGCTTRMRNAVRPSMVKIILQAPGKS